MTRLTLKRVPVWLQLFVACFIQSGIITINFRAVAQARYVEAFVSDLGLFLFGFFIVKRVTEAKKIYEAIAYAIGGASGASLCIWISKELFGQ